MKKVSIVEVGPRDGLQNETKTLDVASRFQFVEALSQAGLDRIEIGAFVSDKWVPQMAGSSELSQKIKSAQASGKLPKKLTLSDIQAAARMRGGECLSKEYFGSSKPLRFRCANGHQWETKPSYIRNGRNWCPYCANKVPHTLESMKHQY